MSKKLKSSKNISSETASNLSLCAKEQLTDAIHSQILETMKLPEEYSCISDNINIHGYYVLKIAHNLNGYYEVISGKAFVNAVKTDIAADLSLLCEKAEKIVARRGISLTCTAPAEPIFISTDLERLYYSVLDILLNAAENTPCGGRIHVFLSKTKSFVKITITDNGTGMDEESLAHCFEPFFSAASGSKTRKMGLGLTLARHFVKNTGGRISVRSEPGKGTAVSLLLPLPADEELHLSAGSPVADILEAKISPVEIVFSELFVPSE